MRSGRWRSEATALIARGVAGAARLRPGRPRRDRAAPLAHRRRTLAFVVVVAVGSATAGWYASRGIRSPDEIARAAAAPPASPITVPVERRELRTAVVVRGDVAFAQSTEVSIDTDLGDGAVGTQVVSGQVPRPGQELAEGAVAIEVSGRPVFLLTGALPMYRALRPGMSGKDVLQVEQALRRLRLFAGTPDQRYDAATETALSALYRNAGYEPVGPSTQERQQVGAAEAQLSAARAALREAESALADASRPPPRSTLLAAENAVDEARAALSRAQAELATARNTGADQATINALEAAVRAARSQLALAEAQLSELLATPDTAVLRRAVEEAKDTAAAAKAALAEARGALGVRIPRGEIVFISSLPRRVDRVEASVGGTPGSPAFSLTAENLQVNSSVSLDERPLVQVGTEVRLDDPASGTALTGTVTTVADTPGTDGAPPGSFHVQVTPTGGEPAKLAGLNLRLTIPVKATDGAVLVVPQAALVTDASGTVRVRTMPGAAAGTAVERHATTVDIEVSVGLAADGFVEVAPITGELREGDLVVVGEQR